MDELRAFDVDRVFLNFETVLDGHVLRDNPEDGRRRYGFCGIVLKK